MGSLEEGWNLIPFEVIAIAVAAMFVLGLVFNAILVWRNGSEARNLAAARLEETGLRCTEMEIRIEEAKQRQSQAIVTATARAELDRLNILLANKRLREATARATLTEQSSKLGAMRQEEAGFRRDEARIRAQDAERRQSEGSVSGEQRVEADRLNVRVMEHRVRETGARAQLAELALDRTKAKDAAGT